MKTKSLLIILTVFVLALTGAVVFGQDNATPTPEPEPAYLATSDADYAALNLKRGTPEIWEDGLRTDGKEGSYEWWYTDAEFEDGTTIVVVFFTKSGFDVSGPAQPTATFNLTYPDGTTISRTIHEKGHVIDAAVDRADVRVQESYLRYVDGDYELQFIDGDLTYKVLMESKLPMWRPETGHDFFGNDAEYFFAWFVAQPRSAITGTLSIDGKTTELAGTGYHDHNWGNIAMNEVINHWYWGRVQIDDYTIITADIIAVEKYGYARMPLFFIAKDGEILNTDLAQVEVQRADTIQHPQTNKFMDNHLTYTQTDEMGVEYKVEFFRQDDILYQNLLDTLPTAQKTLATLLGENPTYLRIVGDVRLTVKDGDSVQVYEAEGLWEQMFFGKNKNALIGARGQG